MKTHHRNYNLLLTLLNTLYHSTVITSDLEAFAAAVAVCYQRSYHTLDVPEDR
jgi:hypothetical protein